jgi:hypothetical protein
MTVSRSLTCSTRPDAERGDGDHAEDDDEEAGRQSLADTEAVQSHR